MNNINENSDQTNDMEIDSQNDQNEQFEKQKKQFLAQAERQRNEFFRIKQEHSRESMGLRENFYTEKERRESELQQLDQQILQVSQMVLAQQIAADSQISSLQQQLQQLESQREANRQLLRQPLAQMQAAQQQLLASGLFQSYTLEQLTTQQRIYQQQLAQQQHYVDAQQLLQDQFYQQQRASLLQHRDFLLTQGESIQNGLLAMGEAKRQAETQLVILENAYERDRSLMTFRQQSEMMNLQQRHGHQRDILFSMLPGFTESQWFKTRETLSEGVKRYREEGANGEDRGRDAIGELLLEAYDLDSDYLSFSERDVEIQVTGLPPEIKMFKDRIKFLELGGVKCSELPDWLYEFENLEKLDAGMSGLERVSADIGKLKNLKWLSLAGNTDLKDISAVTTLENLWHLSLDGNINLSGLPEDIGRLKNLRYLSASQCFLDALPDTLCELSELRTLDLEENPDLTALPDNTGALSNLRELNVEETGIKDLPESIVHLPRRCHIRLGESEITKETQEEILERLEGRGPQLFFEDYDPPELGDEAEQVIDDADRLETAIRKWPFDEDLIEYFVQLEKDLEADLPTLRSDNTQEEMEKIQAHRLLKAASPFLDAIMDAEDFQNEKTRQGYIDRVHDLFKSMRESEKVRQVCGLGMIEALAHCSDRADLALGKVETRHIIHRAIKDNYSPEKVFNLCVGMFNGQVLETLALLKEASLKGTDGLDFVEIEQALKIPLKDKLQLVGVSNYMRWQNVSFVTPHDEKAGEKLALALCSEDKEGASQAIAPLVSAATQKDGNYQAPYFATFKEMFPQLELAEEYVKHQHRETFEKLEKAFETAKEDIVVVVPSTVESKQEVIDMMNAMATYYEHAKAEEVGIFAEVKAILEGYLAKTDENHYVRLERELGDDFLQVSKAFNVAANAMGERQAQVRDELKSKFLAEFYEAHKHLVISPDLQMDKGKGKEVEQSLDEHFFGRPTAPEPRPLKRREPEEDELSEEVEAQLSKDVSRSRSESGSPNLNAPATPAVELLKRPLIKRQNTDDSMSSLSGHLSGLGINDQSGDSQQSTQVPVGSGFIDGFGEIMNEPEALSAPSSPKLSWTEADCTLLNSLIPQSSLAGPSRAESSSTRKFATSMGEPMVGKEYKLIKREGIGPDSTAIIQMTDRSFKKVDGARVPEDAKVNDMVKVSPIVREAGLKVTKSL